MISIDNRLKFEERVDMEETEMTTLYFMGDVTLLKDLTNRKPDEDCTGMTLSVEFPTNEASVANAEVEISPSREEEDAIVDYDWTQIVLPDDEVETLIRIGLKTPSGYRFDSEEEAIAYGQDFLGKNDYKKIVVGENEIILCGTCIPYEDEFYPFAEDMLKKFDLAHRIDTAVLRDNLIHAFEETCGMKFLDACDEF